MTTKNKNLKTVQNEVFPDSITFPRYSIPSDVKDFIGLHLMSGWTCVVRVEGKDRKINGWKYIMYNEEVKNGRKKRKEGKFIEHDYQQGLWLFCPV